MKTTIKLLLVIIVMINISCINEKKKSIEPDPPKTSKSFSAKVTYTQDSMNTYYYSGMWNSTTYSTDITISIHPDTAYSSLSANMLAYKPTIFIGADTPKLTATLNFNLSSNDLDKPLTYWIRVYFHVYKSVNNTPSTTRWGTMYKQYTFVEGDNGTINFNTLP